MIGVQAEILVDPAGEVEFVGQSEHAVRSKYFPAIQLQAEILVDPADEVEFVGQDTHVGFSVPVVPPHVPLKYLSAAQFVVQVVHSRLRVEVSANVSYSVAVHVLAAEHVRSAFADSGTLSYCVVVLHVVAVAHVLSDVLDPAEDIYLLFAEGHVVQAVHDALPTEALNFPGSQSRHVL